MLTILKSFVFFTKTVVYFNYFSSFALVLTPKALSIK